MTRYDAKGIFQLALKKNNLQYRSGCPTELHTMLYPLHEEAEDKDLSPDMVEFI